MQAVLNFMHIRDSSSGKWTNVFSNNFREGGSNVTKKIIGPRDLMGKET